MFHINYQVRSSKNTKSKEEIFFGCLADAIDSYQPDAGLSIQIGSAKIELNIDRDMYGFHDDILKIIEAIVFDLPNYGPYNAINYIS